MQLQKCDDCFLKLSVRCFVRRMGVEGNDALFFYVDDTQQPVDVVLDRNEDNRLVEPWLIDNLTNSPSCEYCGNRKEPKNKTSRVRRLVS